MSNLATVTAFPTGRPIEKCKTTGQPDDWYPHEPQIERPEERKRYEAYAEELCAGCPFAAQCLEQALTDESQYGVHAHGIFGGVAPWQRDNMRRSEQRRTQRHIAPRAVA
jgi:hypothetical protein